ncbi:hypothetical protein N0O83_29875 [Streptomyces atratus]|nr:hypothetical protein [Streptomyces atratus]MCT2546978.1 hypothetical protein [Streptomyces atratus]
MLAGLPAVALLLACPATHADDDTSFGSGANAANTWNFRAAAVCFQELALVPVASPWTGNTLNGVVNFSGW